MGGTRVTEFESEFDIGLDVTMWDEVPYGDYLSHAHDIMKQCVAAIEFPRGSIPTLTYGSDPDTFTTNGFFDDGLPVAALGETRGLWPVAGFAKWLDQRIWDEWPMASAQLLGHRLRVHAEIDPEHFTALLLSSYNVCVIRNGAEFGSDLIKVCDPIGGWSVDVIRWKSWTPGQAIHVTVSV